MWLLWQQDEIYVRLYAMLTPLSVDRRLLTLRQLLKHGLVSHHMEDQELEQLARCLLEKPFSEWYRGAFGHIRGLTRRTAMWLLRKYEQLQVFIPEMQSEADAIFALNNGAVIAGQKNWTQVRAAVLTMDRDWLDLKERFSITDEFVEQHLSLIHILAVVKTARNGSSRPCSATTPPARPGALNSSSIL